MKTVKFFEPGTPEMETSGYRRKVLFQFWFFLVLGLFLGWFGRSLASPDTPLPGSQEDPLVSKSYVDMQVKMNVVELPQGKILLGSSGTEIVLRSGKARVIDSQLGGLSDVTAARDLRRGEAVPANHLLIVPRDDGRGVEALSPVILLVRGSYTVK